MSAPARVVGVVSFVDRGSRGRALFREDVCEAQDRLRDALCGDGLRVVVGGSPYHPAERVADDDASARLCSHLLVERRVDAVLALVAEPLADPLAVPYLAQYLSRRVSPPIPFVVGALVVPSAAGAAATIRASATAAATKTRALFGAAVAPAEDAFEVRLDDEPSLLRLRRDLRALGDASACIVREVGYANDLRKHVHVVVTDDPAAHPDVAAAERILVAFGARLAVEPVPAGGRPSPPVDFAVAFADLIRRRAAARRPTDRWWDDPARD